MVCIDNQKTKAMSYDIGLYINTGKEEHEVCDCGNYTYNVSPMYYKAFGEEGIGMFDGMNAGEAIKFLELGIKNMEREPAEYLKLNPSNGWGSYDGALAYLRVIYQGCQNHPQTTIRIY